MSAELDNIRYFLHCWEGAETIACVDVDGRPAPLNLSDLRTIVNDLHYWERLLNESLRQTVSTLMLKGVEPLGATPVRARGVTPTKPGLKAPKGALKRPADRGPLKRPDAPKPLHKKSSVNPKACEDCGELWSPTHDCADPF